MILKIVFLIAYFLLVFIGARLFELYATSIASWKCFNDIIPGIFIKRKNPQQKKSDDSFEGGSYDKFSDEGIASEIDSQQIGLAEDGGDDDDDISYMQVESFKSYVEFEEKVGDSTNIWVVKVNLNPSKSKQHKSKMKQWNFMARRIKKFDFRLGIYSCYIDPKLCHKHNVHTSTVMLITPQANHMKGRVGFNVFQMAENGQGQDENEINDVDAIFKWIKRKLKPKVKTVHSLSELTERPISRYKNVLSKPSMFFVYKSNERVPPLLFSTLSVKFTGRIKFYMFKTEDKLKSGNVFAINPNILYTYGERRGEYFTYSCVEFFLRTLHPEVNDIFVISVILLNMACWLELFVQKGGPLKRLFYYIWGFAIGNIILVSIWLLLIQFLYLPEVQPIIELCLKNFQHVMFTNIAAIIRQDIIQLSKHLHIVIFGFIGYGILLGYLHYKMRSGSDRILFTSVMDIIRYDIEELKELFYSLIGFITPSLRIYRFEEGIERILHRLAAPDLWLHSKCPSDYIHNLPTWTHYCHNADCIEPDHIENLYDEDSPSDADNQNSSMDNKMKSKMNDEDCVICLDLYKCGDVMRGLPCGHCFHKPCIDSWLFPNNEASHHRCPVCRWPADIKKGAIELVDLT